ncbi:MAG TPA: hypothetical protein VF522_23305 [Ramlibacter sp.]
MAIQAALHLAAFMTLALAARAVMARRSAPMRAGLQRTPAHS